MADGDDVEKRPENVLINVLKEQDYPENYPENYPEKTTRKIIDCIENNPQITTAELAEYCNLTIDGIKWQLKQMKQKGLVRRVGPDKGGHWEIVKPE